MLRLGQQKRLATLESNHASRYSILQPRTHLRHTQAKSYLFGDGVNALEIMQDFETGNAAHVSVPDLS